jgi:multiple sugar transport system ATP-binding protein
MAALTLRGLGKRFGRTEVLRALDLHVPDGEFVALVGPSGCGKSTLLRLLAGLEDPSEGEIWMDDVCVNALPPRERGVAMVFQSYALYPHMTAYENLAFGLRQGARLSEDVIDTRVRQAAERLELTPLLQRLPRELSGGQRQRVAIGRAIVRQPRVFLFDEPLSNLDAALRVQMRIELARLHQSLGTTMVYVTHDQTEAMTLADRIVVLNEGQVQQVGPPLELYHRPANRFVAGFIGSPQMNFLPVTAASAPAEAVVHLSDGTPVPVPPLRSSPGAALTLGLRPEHLCVGEAGWPGTVQVVEQLGESHLLHVALATGTLVCVRGTGDAPCREGDAVCVVPATLPSPHPGILHLFNAGGESVLSRAYSAHIPTP